VSILSNNLVIISFTNIILKFLSFIFSIFYVILYL
jgi:hypothetical protein